jgi:hypothetical protein
LPMTTLLQLKALLKRKLRLLLLESNKLLVKFSTDNGF